MYRAKLVEEGIFCGQVDRGGDFLRRKSAFPGLVNGPTLLLAIIFAQVVKRNKDGARIPDTSKHVTIQQIWNLGFKVTSHSLEVITTQLLIPKIITLQLCHQT